MARRVSEGAFELGLHALPLLCCLTCVAAFLCVGYHLTGALDTAFQQVEEQIRAALGKRSTLDDLRQKLDSRMTALNGQMEEVRAAEQSRRAEMSRADAEREGLRSRLQGVREQMTAQQKRLSELEQKKAELEERLKRYRALETPGPEIALADIQLKIAAAKREMEELLKKIQSLRQEKERPDSSNVYWVGRLPGAGKGSWKPALYVECLRGEAVIRPEGRHLSADAHPAAEEEFLKRARETGRVVFLIRPTGFEAFARYRSLLQERNSRGTARIEMGYEPVDADWDLRYPEG